MTQTFKFLLGLFVITFCICFASTVIWWLVDERIPCLLTWADFLSFGLAILCFPAITLSEARRDKQSAKRWTQEHNEKHTQWKNDKEKRGL